MEIKISHCQKNHFKSVQSHLLLVLLKLNKLAVFSPTPGPILKPNYAKIEPYIGKYVPNSDSSEACRDF